MATQLQEPVTVPDAVVAGVDEPEPQTPQERDFEAEARKQGWKPEEEFAEGEKRPAVMRSAQEFIENAESWGATKDKKIDRLMDEIGFLKRQNRKLMSADQERYQEALEQIRKEMRDAVTVGDVAGFDQLEKKADKLREANGNDYMQGEDPNLELARFRRENRWFDRGQLPSATAEEAEAIALFSSISAEYVAKGLDRQLPPSEFFAKIRAEIEEEIPALSASGRTPRAKPASDVAPVTTRTTAKKAKTGANLPADAKATAERYMRMGVFDVKTKEEAYNMMAANWKGDWA